MHVNLQPCNIRHFRDLGEVSLQKTFFKKTFLWVVSNLGLKSLSHFEIIVHSSLKIWQVNERLERSFSTSLCLRSLIFKMTKTEEFYFTFHWYEKIHSLFYLNFAS